MFPESHCLVGIEVEGLKDKLEKKAPEVNAESNPAVRGLGSDQARSFRQYLAARALGFSESL